VAAARKALEAEDADLVLPYVPQSSEDEARAAFEKAIRLHGQGAETSEFADRWFFENVVRLHRDGEGAPYTGLKPAGLDVGPVIPVAERAIERGTPDELVALLTEAVRQETETRLAQVVELRKAADGDLAANRRYVEAMLGLEVWANQLYTASKAEARHGHHAHAG
jgi:hypothetical protein